MKQKTKRTHVIRAQLMAYLEAVLIDLDNPLCEEIIRNAAEKVNKAEKDHAEGKNKQGINSSGNTR